MISKEMEMERLKTFSFSATGSRVPSAIVAFSEQLILMLLLLLLPYKKGSPHTMSEKLVGKRTKREGRGVQLIHAFDPPANFICCT